MKISESWLREWVNPDVSTTELAEQLTMAGLEVDAIEPAAPDFNKVVVAEVIKVSPHPDADKLRVCEVNVGNETLQIVCGASNVREGLHVPAALIGAQLPGGLKIKKSKLRGEQSLGMLCGASEIGLESSIDGLMELPADSPVGDNIRDYLGLDDQIIDVDLTPNRGDCLSVSGVAREIATINKLDYSPDDIPSIPTSIDASMAVDVKNPEACPRYSCRVIKGVNASSETPLWMLQRLTKSGLRSINPIVDVTNYVMLEMGQPMHAFDLNKISAGIVVRQASANEKLTLLDEKEITLNEGDLVIADHNKALALAGIMGGLDSAVTTQSGDILLESAFFNPLSIAGKARQYAMQTDSSYRFERGVNPAQTIDAMERASALILEICGGEIGAIVEVLSDQHLPQQPEVLLRGEEVSRILGVELSDIQIEDILTRLGFSLRKRDDTWIVTVPAHRFDISIEADLIEEIARIYGYNNLPVKDFYSAMVMKPVTEMSLSDEAVFQRLFDRGYQEVITYSFVDPATQQIIHPDVEAIALANPMSSDMEVMRVSHWTGLVNTIDYNIKRQQSQVKIFEYGLKYIKQDNDIKQINVLSGALCGAAIDGQWTEANRSFDFYDLKSDVEMILALTGNREQFSFEKGLHPALHPGQTAVIQKAGETIGWLGNMHPQVLHKLGIKNEIFLFEIDWSAILSVQLPTYMPLSKYPSIKRDLAVVVDERVTSAAIQSVIETELGEILCDVQIFDVYHGKNIDSGRKSVALGLILQDSSRTLIDQEIENATSRVVAQLEKELGATLRD